MSRKICLLIVLMLQLTAYADMLSDILSGHYKARPSEQLLPLSDGERYAQQEGNAIYAYSYKTGAIQDTLFDVSFAEQIDTIEGYLLSPNERYILVYNRREQLFRRSFRAHYFIYDTKRKKTTLLGDGDAVRNPVFSPNSKYIAFAKDNQLYIHKLDFSTEVVVTDDTDQQHLYGVPDWLYEEEFGTTRLYDFSADSKQLAFVYLQEKAVPIYQWQEVLTEGYPTIEQVSYPRAGTDNAEVCVKVYDVQYKSVKTMQLPQQTDSYIPRIRWTNDAEQIAIFRLNRNQNKLEMFYANAKSTVANLIYTEENKNGWVEYDLTDQWQMLSTGEWLVINETDGYKNAYLYTALGQKKKQLTTAKNINHFYGLDEKRGILYYQVLENNATETMVYALNIKSGKALCLTTKRGWHTATFSSNFDYFTDNYSSATIPNIYTLCDRNGKGLRVLRDNASLASDLEAVASGIRKEFLMVEVETGVTLNAWLMYPAGYKADEGKRYPLVLTQYSGPGSHQIKNNWSIGWEYVLASQGYIVACVDVRGSEGRGRKWKEETYMHLGQKESRDLVAFGKKMQQEPMVDAERMAIWGWSYGGFAVLMTMSQSDNPFRCGIAVAPVTDFRMYDSAYTERFMRTPQQNEDGYLACALPLMAERLQGKLLLVHGLADDNVHCQQSWIYIDALIQAGKQFEMQIYPDDNHFLRKRSNHEHLYRRKLLFLENNLK